MSSEFDIIFAGGGTTACVIAGRLAAADPSLVILVIESGQHSRDVAHHVQPCRFVDSLGPNIMAYVRGAASDYDNWEAFGNDGWRFKDLLPLIKRLETFTPMPDGDTHGDAGPIQISAGGADLGIGRQLLDVAREYDPGRPVVDDINDFKTADAYGRAYQFIDPVTGRRSDAASGYLYPHSENLNLTIMAEKRVKRVLIENGRAVGVEYTTDALSGRSDGELLTAKARKLVVVSAGTFGSPSILERSGIGSPTILEANKIPLEVDIPGVGENYQDHVGHCSAFYASDETSTMDDVWNDPQAITGLLKEREDNGTGKVAHSNGESAPDSNTVDVQRVCITNKMGNVLQEQPRQIHGKHWLFSGFPLIRDPRHLVRPGRKFFSFVYSSLYPELSGSVHITSGEDANMSLDFDPHYCSKPADVAQLNLLYKMTRELARRMPAYRGEVPGRHPTFPPDSPASSRETDSPVAIDAQDIVYTEADEEAITAFIRDRVHTTGHSVGTCAMKPCDRGGVVDARLNVYGVECLKVADLSICPSSVGNATYSTALLIGEKAAVIIAEDLNISI